MSNKIVEKIKKLLSLATSKNENESKLATAMANKLLVKHNLTMASLPKEEINYNNHKIPNKRSSVEEKYISSILSEFFFVRVVTSRRDGGQLHFLGEESNVEIALYTRDFLIQAFKAAFKAYKKETGCKQGSKQAFYMGLYKGLSEQLTVKKQEAEQEYGLVVVPDNGLAEFMSNELGRVSNRNSRVRTGDSAATDAGTSKGRNMRISKGITSSSKSNLTIAC